jgi:Zn-dependent M28 family amino/carboxypeptidase
MVVVFCVVLGASLAVVFVTGPVIVRAARLDVAVEPSPDRLHADVLKLCSDFAPRDGRHPDQLDRTAQWIGRELTAAGLEVELQPYDLDRGRASNVIGHRPGRDPSAAAIVIGAHYDALPGTPGANDNASGVAALIELARTLPAARPSRPLYLVAFADAMGSYQLANRFQREGVAVLQMVALDLVGYSSETPDKPRWPALLHRLLYPGRGESLVVIGDLRSGAAIRFVKQGLLVGGKLPVHSFRGMRESRLVSPSDHISFRRLGYPAVRVTDVAFLLHAAYGKAEDTPDKLDYRRLADVVLALHGLLQEGG